MQTLTAGSFLNLENASTVEALKFTARRLAEHSASVVKENLPPASLENLARQLWEKAEYVTRETERRRFHQIFVEKGEMETTIGGIAGPSCEKTAEAIKQVFGKPARDEKTRDYHVQPQVRRQIPAPQANLAERILLKIILVEAANGIVKAIRVTTLSPEFTEKLHDAIRQQATGEEFSRAEFVARSLAVYGKHAPFELAARAIVKMKGGD